MYFNHKMKLQFLQKKPGFHEVHESDVGKQLKAYGKPPTNEIPWELTYIRAKEEKLRKNED